MEIINGLLVKQNNVDFLLTQKAFATAEKKYPQYSMLIEYLKFRFFDAYDLLNFINNLTPADKKNNTDVYKRMLIEKDELFKHLYGPFYTGRDNDNLEFLNDNPLNVLERIINSSNLNNEKMVNYLNDSHCDNMYDFYKSLYLQKKENSSLTVTINPPRTEEDEEFILWNYTNLRHEQDKRPTISIPNTPKEKWKELIYKYQNSEIDDPNEPNDLELIIKNSNFFEKKDKVFNYEKKLFGAIIGRFIGCMLGAPVENYSIDQMEKMAQEQKMSFPPTSYWKKVNYQDNLHYKRDKRFYFCEDKMNFVLADDDVTYTVLNALILKKYGIDFSSNDIFNFWKDYLPYACTAEYATMIGARRNKKILEIVNSNPYVELIGAAIRADAFGYICPGNPFLAAKLAYKDAFISHKRNGIYGEMYLSAVIAKSFTSSSPLEAIKSGLDYIPNNCRLRKDLEWAISYQNKLIDYKHASSLIEERFKFMNRVHTNNNLCAIVFALILGGTDFDKVISNCIAIGFDNDCTGASVGSIMGAFLSIDGINKKWYQCFNDNIHTYIRGFENIKISKLFNMFLEIYNDNKKNN